MRGTADDGAAAEAWLAARARRSPAAPALVHDGRVTDYRTLAAAAARRAAQLAELGVARGDVVAVLHPNHPEVVVLVWAALARGAVLLPLNIRLSPEELAYQLRDALPRLLVHAQGEWAVRAEDAAARAGGVRRAWLEDGALRGVAARAGSPGEARCGDAAWLLYTSGTTGRPKGALLSAHALRASAEGSEQLLGRASGERWLACMPLHHVGGLSILVRACLSGGCVVLHARFDPEAVSAALDADAISGVSLVANMLGRVLDARGEREAPPALRCALVGGGPTPVPLLARARSLAWPVAPTYGLTEAASQVATRPPEDDTPPLDRRLRPLPGSRLRVVDGEGRDVPSGGVGEILVRGPTLMQGYLGLPDATRRALAGGWLHTGDLGALDPHGWLHVESRREDLIVSGGENVYPAEIEAVLEAHPAVAEAGVVGEPDADYGARPVAYWVRAGETADASPDLAAWCRERLAGYKVPVRFERRDALPRTASGKLLRRALG